MAAAGATKEKMNMRSVVLSAMLLTLIAVCSVPVSSQVYNGSFESGAFISPGGWLVLGLGSDAVDGWTIDQGSVDYIGGWWPASDGERNLDMSGVGSGKISQYVATVPGASYVVSFDMSGNPDGLPLVKQLTVTTDGANAVAFFYDISANSNSRSDMKWVAQQYTFTAQADWTLLSFTSDTDTAYGPTLDNVSMDLVPTEEEPASDGTICHRNNGRRGQQTLVVDPHAAPAHLAHGDTIGPCSE